MRLQHIPRATTPTPRQTRLRCQLLITKKKFLITYTTRPTPATDPMVMDHMAVLAVNRSYATIRREGTLASSEHLLFRKRKAVLRRTSEPLRQTTSSLPDRFLHLAASWAAFIDNSIRKVLGRFPETDLPFNSHMFIGHLLGHLTSFLTFIEYPGAFHLSWTTFVISF